MDMKIMNVNMKVRMTLSFIGPTDRRASPLWNIQIIPLTLFLDQDASAGGLLVTLYHAPGPVSIQVVPMTGRTRGCPR